MTVREEVQAGLDRWTVSHPFVDWKPTLRVVPGVQCARGRKVQCELVVELPERDDGTPFRTETAFYVTHGTDPKTWGGEILSALLDRLEHEAREALRIDGELHDDPHHGR